MTVEAQIGLDLSIKELLSSVHYLMKSPPKPFPGDYASKPVEELIEA